MLLAGWRQGEQRDLLIFTGPYLFAGVPLILLEPDCLYGHEQIRQNIPHYHPTETVRAKLMHLIRQRSQSTAENEKSATLARKQLTRKVKSSAQQLMRNGIVSAVDGYSSSKQWVFSLLVR
ncbi:unnamed protein product [Gongylonema pulchrum]|uniref:Exostosin domain-containing protein n=1 Tax=Gongylonema pulchrum TaxID=637853 RepID=A0A183ESC4_9BILA|nr:unnamed protein product [Gongylonema pulchrum]